MLVHLVEPLPLDRQRSAGTTIAWSAASWSCIGQALATKPEIIVVSKGELTGSDEVRDRLEDELGREVLAISAVTGQGLAQLVGRVAEQLQVA